MPGEPNTLLIRGGRVLDPATGRDEIGDVCIFGEQIVASLPGSADATIDASGCLVLPGFVEPHAVAPAAGVDSRFARQALAGGFTTVAAFGTARRARGFDGFCPRLLPIAPLTRPGERRLAELGDAAAAGAVAFGDGADPHGDSELLRRGLLYASMLGKPVFDRPRDPVLSEGGVAHVGEVAASQGLFGVTVASETVALRRGLTLAAECDATLHFTAVSSADAVGEMAEEARRGRRRPPTFAVTAAHLLRTAEALRGFDPAGRVDPPFRDAADRAALVAACRDADSLAVAVSSGHRPDPGLLDPVDLLAAPPGFEGFETAATAAWTALEGDAAAFARLLVAGPAGVLGLPVPSLEVGEGADVVVFDPAAEWIVDPAALAAPVARSPLAGRTLAGRVTHTVLGGRVAFDRGRFPG